MKQVKAGKPLVDFIKLCYAADKPCLLIGRHGVGKSDLVAQAAKALGISYICRDLSLMEPPDLVGMPKLDGGVTKFLPPSFLPTEGKGILAFEELNRCPSYMRAPCLQLLTARCLNDYVLPPGWLPCAAINPSEEGYEVNDLDKALLSRFVKVQVIPDRAEWLGWSKNNHVCEEVRSYVGSDAQIFADTSPRDWSMVSSLMEAYKKENLDRGTLQAAIQGVVGKERCVTFSIHLKSGLLLPKVPDILADYGTYQGQIRSWTKEGKTDLLANIAHEAMIYLQDGDNYREVKKNTWFALKALLTDIPPDTASMIAKFMVDLRYEVPKYGKAAKDKMVLPDVDENEMEALKKMVTMTGKVMKPPLPGGITHTIT